jgi:hypothetical protein
MDSEEVCKLLGMDGLDDEKRREQMQAGGMPGALVRRTRNIALMRALTITEVDEIYRMDVFNVQRCLGDTEDA